MLLIIYIFICPVFGQHLSLFSNWLYFCLQNHNLLLPSCPGHLCPTVWPSRWYTPHFPLFLLVMVWKFQFVNMFEWKVIETYTLICSNQGLLNQPLNEDIELAVHFFEAFFGCLVLERYLLGVIKVNIKWSVME